MQTKAAYGFWIETRSKGVHCIFRTILSFDSICKYAHRTAHTRSVLIARSHLTEFIRNRRNDWRFYTLIFSFICKYHFCSIIACENIGPTSIILVVFEEPSTVFFFRYEMNRQNRIHWMIRSIPDVYHCRNWLKGKNKTKKACWDVTRLTRYSNSSNQLSNSKSEILGNIATQMQ